MNALWRTLLISLVLIIPLSIWAFPGVVALVFGALFFVAPLWLPPLLLLILVPVWITYVRSQYVFSVPYTVLELKPGKETPKTARAMELIFYSLYHRVDVTRLEGILLGKVRIPWSFEIAAENGRVRFFMRIPTSHRAAIESRVRAEYRDIDIDEIQDYAREIPFDPISMRLEAREFRLAKPDPYPIRSYEAYESAKKPTNPFLDFLEDCSTVGEEERLLISFIVRPHQRDRRRFWQEPKDTLHGDARTEIEKIVGALGDIRQLPESKKQLVVSIEKGLTRPSFDCGIRALYLAPRENFSSERVGLLERLFDRFSDAELNGFVAENPRSAIGWPLTDVFRAVPPLLSAYFLNLYRRRAFFAPPYHGKPFILNTAELATVFHVPCFSRSSSLARDGTLEPPENLPHRAAAT